MAVSLPILKEVIKEEATQALFPTPQTGGNRSVNDAENNRLWVNHLQLKVVTH